MAEVLLMLALSPTMDQGLIAKWLKAEGDEVASGDILCEVETDKATMDYETTEDGTLLKILVPEGAPAAVGDPIAIVGESGEDIEELVASLPKRGGGQPVAGPASGDDEAEAAPAAATDTEAAATEQTAAQPSEGAVGDDGFVRASPLARKLAQQHGLELGAITGTGPAGRVVKADVDAALAAGTAQQAAQPAAAAAAAAPRRAAAGEDRVIPHSGMRRIIAERLSESKYSAPHYYLKLHAEMDEVLAAREALNRRADPRVSLNAFILKFVAEALRRHPRVNAGWQDDAIVEFGSIDIGLAVAQDDGLITPVVRDVANRGIVEIDSELRDLIARARANRLQPEEYQNATFTISSLGSLGIEDFTAIINPPGSAILAIGAITREAVVQDDDSLAIRSRMGMSLSCDHRVIDGAVGAAFLAELRAMLESPIAALY